MVPLGPLFEDPFFDQVAAEPLGGRLRLTPLAFRPAMYVGACDLTLVARYTAGIWTGLWAAGLLPERRDYDPSAAVRRERWGDAGADASSAEQWLLAKHGGDHAAAIAEWVAVETEALRRALTPPADAAAG